MCNYSNEATAFRDAVKGDDLTVNRGGLYDTADLGMAVCLKPGTELGFDESIKHCGTYRYVNHEWHVPEGFKEQVAISRIVGPENLDALEFADGSRMLLSNLIAGQRATVLQLPAQHQHEASQQEAELVD